MIDEIKFLINKYVVQESEKIKVNTLEAQKNMEALESLPLVMSLRRKIRRLENELSELKEQPNVFVNVKESECDKIKRMQLKSSDNLENLDNVIVDEVNVNKHEESTSSSNINSFNDINLLLDKKLTPEEIANLTPFYQKIYLDNQNKITSQNGIEVEEITPPVYYETTYTKDKNGDWVKKEEKEDTEKITYPKDIPSLYGFPTVSYETNKDEEVEVEAEEEEEEEEEVEVEEDDEEEVEEEEQEEVEEEEEEEEVEGEEEEEEEEVEVEGEEEEEEEEVEVEGEEEEEEEEMEVFEHTINGKIYYVTSLTNGEIYDEDDEEFENPIGKLVNSKATFY